MTAVLLYCLLWAGYIYGAAAALVAVLLLWASKEYVWPALRALLFATLVVSAGAVVLSICGLLWPLVLYAVISSRKTPPAPVQEPLP